MGDWTFDVLQESLLPDICAIYNHYILHTTATFHTETFTPESIRNVVPIGDARFVCYTIHERGNLIGYCLLAPFKNREAYSETAEVSVYLRPEFVGKGAGTAALRYLDVAGRERGFRMLVAGICGENTASLRLFERNAYRQCARFRAVGRKFGRLLDVVYYQKEIAGNHLSDTQATEEPWTTFAP